MGSKRKGGNEKNVDRHIMLNEEDSIRSSNSQSISNAAVVHATREKSDVRE